MFSVAGSIADNVEQPHQCASLRVALELGLIEALLVSQAPKSSRELAEIVRAEQLLVSASNHTDVAHLPYQVLATKLDQFVS